MKRKIQQLGGSYIIALPKEWCIANNIDKGDEIEITKGPMSMPSLLISPIESNNISANEITISVNNDIDLDRLILGSYLDGYDIIKITNIPEDREVDIRNKIRKMLSKLFASREIEIGDISTEIHVQTELIPPLVVIEELFIKSKKMVKDAIKAYKNEDHSLANDVILREDDADELYFFIVRSLKKILRNPWLSSKVLTIDRSIEEKEFHLEDALDLRMIALYLENLADSAENLAEKVIERHRENIKPNRVLIKEIENEIIQLVPLLEDSFTSYITGNSIKAKETINDYYKIIKLIKKQDKIDDPIIGLIINILDCIKDISDLVGESVDSSKDSGSIEGK